MRNWLLALRRQLVIWLAGNDSVMVNVDFWGKVHFKGRFLANENSIAQPMTRGQLQEAALDVDLAEGKISYDDWLDKRGFGHLATGRTTHSARDQV